MIPPRGASGKVCVLLVGPLPPPYGGIPSYVVSLSRAPWHDIETMNFNTAMPSSVAPLDREGRGYGALLENGLLSALRMITFVAWSYILFAKAVITNKPHVVQVFTSSYWGYWRNFIYILIARVSARKTIFHLLNAIDAFYDNSGVIQKRLIRLSFHGAHLNLLQSPGLEQWFHEHSQAPAKGLWNGIALKTIPTKGPKLETIADFSGPTGITVGLLGEAKGTGSILKCLQSLSSRNILVNWIFVGGGDLAEYQGKAASLGLAGRVFFAGRVADSLKWQYLHHADFFCLPSIAEGQPIAIIEAMALGLPVIASDVGSIPEVLDHGQCGLLMKPFDLDSLEEAIRKMVQDQDLRRSLGIAAQGAAYRRHDICMLFDNLRQVYGNLTNDKF